MVGNFCRDDIWNLNETWNVDVPDLTTCFQDTVFVFAPCLVFSAFAIINLCLMSRHIPHQSLPWTWRIILKLILGVHLFIISVAWCSLLVYKLIQEGDVPISTITASFSRSFTHLIIIALMLKHRSHGISTSTTLAMVWMCFAIFGAVMHRSAILKYSEYGSPLEEEAFISSIFYLWFNRTVYIGYKRLLTVKDFLPLALKLKSSFVYKKLSTYWQFHLSESEYQKKSLVWAVLKSFWPWWLAGLTLELLYVLFALVPPLLLDGILKFIDNDHFAWRSYFYCGAIFIITFLKNTIDNNCIMYLLSNLLQVKSSLISAIFRKNLLISSAARKDFNSGSITNLVSVDVNRIADFALFAPTLFSCPCKIILILYMMWQYLGPSCLAGAAVIVVLLPITFYVSRVSERYMDKQMELKDLRLKVMNEILQGIKILKFYAWEVPFSLKVSKIRKEEIRFIRFSQMCFVIMNFVFSCAPILVSLASFTTYLLIDSKHVLDPATAFVSLNLLDQLRSSLYLIPDTLSQLIQTITSFERIKTFLSAEETDASTIGKNPDEGNAVTFRKASLFWSKESFFMLQNIDFCVNFGKLIAVIGPVGSGKSSLLSSVLGEMHKSSGSVDVKGSLAYVPQEAWILNRTLKNNILLEKPANEAVYNKILDCCCLRPDLEILPGGDATEIGEKGINLSGGQKQRISLARAVFQNRDIYLMDDPLSAVDAHVRKALFEDVIGNKGLLKNKTRILVTHDISVLPSVDLIIRMDEGKILESGTYQELMEGNGSFLNFIQTHSGLANSLGSGDSGNKIETSAASDSKSKNVYIRTISEDIAKTSEVKLLNNATALIEDEKMEEGGVKRGIYLNYMRHLGWSIFFLSLLGYITFTVFEAGGNIWVADWSSDSVTNGTDKSQTMWRISIYGGIGTAQTFTIIFAVACLIYGSTRAADLYHREMFNSILKSPMSFFDTTPMGRIINRFSTDMDTIDIHIIYNLEGVITCLLHSISTVIVIGMNTPIFLTSIIPLGIVYYSFLKLHLNTSRQISRLESTTRSPIYSHMLESIYGASSIKAFELEKEFIAKLEENVDRHIACNFNTASCNRWLHFWLDLIGSAVILVAAILAIESREKLGASFVGLVIMYALSVTDSLLYLIRANTQLENQSVSIERIDEYCHLMSEAPWLKPDDDPDETWPESGEIVFDNYSARYRENLDLVLKDVNINIHSDEKVGIVGRTGAGKSSVTLSLFRIIEPANGTILIDNVDISQIGLHTLRSKLTIIPQDPVLFTGTLRFNLDPNDEYDDSSIWDSLEKSHLKDFVSSLADGLQHSIEEGGQNLSAGQKQLLCLSRALLKKSKILILDEATAAVDMDTDSLVQDTIKTAFAKHVVITIAHRLNTIMDYDKIIVMDFGSVAEVGSPRELLQNQSSHFFDMARKAGLVQSSVK